MLELKNLKLTINDGVEPVQVLNGINLQLEKKKIYVMTGPNGGGKTSIAKSIMGIYQPTGGQIILDGEDITNKSITERARLGIGYAFQQPPRFKGLTVRDVLKLAAGSNNSIDECDLLYDVGLCAQEYLNREMNATLSGGELKRIEIATLLAQNLKVAVFDEPEAGIDLWSFQKLTETFEKMHRKFDTTMIIISHQERILRIADEVILVTNGTINEITSREKILSGIELTDGCSCRNNCSREELLNVECDR